MADERVQIGDLDLERLVELDETIKKFHSDIQEANDVLEEEDFGAEEAAELVAMLDEGWKYLNHICVVSGKVYTSEGEELILDADRVASLGAGLVMPDEDEDEIRIYHQLGILEGNEVVDSFWIDPGEDAIVQIKPIAKIEEESIEALEYHYPDLKSELDVMILNSDDAVEGVKKLSDFMFEHDPEKVEPDEYRVMVESYINKILVFGDKVPYSVAFKGAYFVAIASVDGNTFRLEKPKKWRKRIATPINVILLSTAQMCGELEKSEDKVSMPALLISSVDPENGTEEVLAIPISADYFKIVSNMERIQESFKDFELE